MDDVDPEKMYDPTVKEEMVKATANVFRGSGGIDTEPLWQELVDQ
ncbi:MAG: hypothetical protein ABEI52_06390 [Halobacteriaceae archaeon]